MSGDLPTDFGFPISVHAHEPDTVYVVPIKSDSEHFPPDSGDNWAPIVRDLPAVLSVQVQTLP